MIDAYLQPIEQIEQRVGPSSYGWVAAPWAGTSLSSDLFLGENRTHKIHVTDDIELDLALDLSDKVLAVKRTFDIPLLWIAKIIRVDRQTLYLWLKGNGRGVKTPRPSNLERLEQLITLAARWNQLSPRRFTRKHALHRVENRFFVDWMLELDLVDARLLSMLERVSRLGEAHALVKPLSQRMVRIPLPADVSLRERVTDRKIIAEPKD